VTRRTYVLAAVALGCAALWVAMPEQGYALTPGEAELDTVSIGKLEVGMPVRLKPSEGAGPTGTVVKFIRRDEGGRSTELAVVAWVEEEGAPQRPAPLAALEPLDAGAAMQVAKR
jgi:hypothetical protein